MKLSCSILCKISILSFQLLGCGNGKAANTVLLIFPDESGNPVSFQIHGNRAVMVGTLDETRPSLVADLIAANPQGDTIILKAVPGNVNSAVSMNAGRLVRSNGPNTLVPSDGAIVSGGTDFFLAGVDRVVEAGGLVGVHSWTTEGLDGKTIHGSDLSWDEPLPLPFKAYYREMGIPEDFYWFSINVGPTSAIDFMNDGELQAYHVEFISSSKVNQENHQTTKTAGV